jgi:hypothetical protein
LDSLAVLVAAMGAGLLAVASGTVFVEAAAGGAAGVGGVAVLGAGA